jgi:hypothetical protein
VVGRDHGVEFAAHRAHEYCIRRKRSENSRGARRGRQDLGVLIPESPAIPGVRVERAQRNSRRGDSEPPLQPVARDARGFDDGIRR